MGGMEGRLASFSAEQWGVVRSLFPTGSDRIEAAGEGGGGSRFRESSGTGVSCRVGSADFGNLILRLASL